MYRESGGLCPDNWQTDEVLKWIQDNDDSKGDIKSRVLGVVQANDLDGHTLKQLAAEKDEIQSLFPALKDRLAFKSMLRNIFKEEVKLLPTDPPSNITPKHSPPVPVASFPHKLQAATSFPAPQSNLRFPITTSTRTYLPREGPTLPARPRELHCAVDMHQVTQKRTVVERQPMGTSSVLPKKIRDLINVDKSFTFPVSSVHFSMNSSSPMNSSTQPLYFNSQAILSPPAKRQAYHQSDTSSSPVCRSVASSCTAPSVTQTFTSIQLPTAALERPPQTSPPSKRQALHHSDSSSSPVSRSVASSCTAPSVTQTITAIQLPTAPLERPLQTSPPAKRQAIHHSDTSSSPVSRSVASSSYTAPSVTQTITSIQRPTTPPLEISSVTSYGFGVPSETFVASNSWSVTGSSNSPPKPYRKPNSSSAGFYRFINYPAPIPDFSDDVLEYMNKMEGVRPSVRKRIMRDSAQFYINISMGQRLNSNDYANIGRTLIEKFPALSCGGPIPWALFNKSLSQCIRNLRRRLKKVNGGFQSLYKCGDDLVSGSAVAFDPDDLSDEEIKEVTCIEIGKEEEDKKQDVFFIKEEIPAWTDDQVQYNML